MEGVLPILTLSACALLVYAYFGYPLLLWLVSRRTASVRTSDERPNRWPTVSVLISAHNEAAVISRRISNLLDQDYPRDRLQILIGSDGSTDGTAAAIIRRQFPRTQCWDFVQRRGKASVLNDLASRATGEFLVFTDAATMFHGNAIKELIMGFWRYPSAAVIGGRLDLQSPDTGKNVDGLYWRYEMFLKMHESTTGAGLGASGAIYAVRKCDYQRLPTGTMADDLLEPLLVRLRTAGDVVLHTPARAWQLTPRRVADEFHRRVRTGAGILHALLHASPLLGVRWGKVALALWSHKLLRLSGPWLLLMALVGSWLLSDRPLFQGLFIAQIGVYAVGLLSGLVGGVPLLGKAATAVRYFFVLNAALAVGFLQMLSGRAQPAWRRTIRPVEPMAAAWGSLDQTAEERPERHRPAA
jgi:cellulose synthase/poly-beta-1,6-N-acetylglucosamine synthase-like glycosyltransferase